MSMVVHASLPDSVVAEPGRGGLPRLVVAGPAGSAEVYRQGAHVTAWSPRGEQDVLWMSGHSNYAPGMPLRGGVPICFPWFGPTPDGTGALHGFARTAPWTLSKADEVGSDVELTFTLADADLPSQVVTDWPHPFRAQLTVTVGEGLTLTLQVTNTGAQSITFQEAFHTYLAVGDVRHVEIHGLADCAYVDRTAHGASSTADGVPLTIAGEIDRVYDQPGTIVVADHVGGRSVAITATGSTNAVVWNPGPVKAAGMADLGDDEWTGMLCIETCNVLGSAITLPAGGTHAMSARIDVQPGT